MPATAYLDLTSLKALSLAPDELFTEVETRYPGWIAAQCLAFSGQIDAVLRKRYATPFLPPYPQQVRIWLERLVTPRAYFKRGVDPHDQQINTLIEDAQRVWAELKEAADAQNGLYDLPLRDDTDGSGIVKNRVQFRADPDPYTGTDRQAKAYRGPR